MPCNDLRLASAANFNLCSGSKARDRYVHAYQSDQSDCEGIQRLQSLAGRRGANSREHAI